MMKKLIPAMMLLALGLSSCAVKTVSRTELLTPTLATAVNSKELIDMKYYGSDTEYDYFTRGYSRYRVLKSENCLPESARFNFDNWKNGKLYRDCLKDSVGGSLVSKLQGLLNAATANGSAAQTLPAASSSAATTPAVKSAADLNKALQNYTPKSKTGQVLKSLSEQYKASKAQ